jgi:hypothetical protein
LEYVIADAIFPSTSILRSKPGSNCSQSRRCGAEMVIRIRRNRPQLTIQSTSKSKPIFQGTNRRQCNGMHKSSCGVREATKSSRIALPNRSHPKRSALHTGSEERPLDNISSSSQVGEEKFQHRDHGHNDNCAALNALKSSCMLMQTDVTTR